MVYPVVGNCGQMANFQGSPPGAIEVAEKLPISKKNAPVGNK